MTQITFLIQGSAPQPYTVQFEMNGTRLTITCDCPAGSMGQMCKHRLNLFSGIMSDIVSDNPYQLSNALEWYKKSPIYTEIQNLSLLEKELDKAKKNINDKKKQIARLCDGQ